MNQKLFCVADGGGTKTEFLLISDSGNLLARCLLQGCNPNQVGIIEACNTLSRGFEELQRNCNSSEIQGYYAGIAGALSGQNAEKMQNALRAKFSPMIVESDIMNVIYTSRNPSACIAAIAGTGSAVFGYDGNELFRMGGWGYLLDDAGSGYAIGRDLLRFCLSVEENGFGSEWPGLQRIHEQVGGTLLTHLDRIYADGPQCVASFAPLAFDLAREGDETALHIIRKSASYLAERILSVREQCACGNRLLLAGGLFRSKDIFLPMIESSLAGSCEIEVTDIPPILGACQRAYACLDRLTPNSDRMSRLRESYPANDVSPTLCETENKPFITPPAPKLESPTEARNIRSKHLDQMSTLAMLRLIHDENIHSAESISGALAAIANAVDCVANAFEKGGRLIYVGAGTSGRLAVQDASECPPTYGVSPDRVIANIAGGDRAVFRAVESVEDQAEAGRADLIARQISANDVVMGISASGQAEYVASALRFAREKGCPTIALSSHPNSKIGAIADITIFTDTGAEVVTGSTRMKAGNAQKMVMNMITTCAMVKTGKVYENLMINLKPTNQKLRRRMIRIVSQITNASEEESSRALEAGNYHIRTAIELIHKHP